MEEKYCQSCAMPMSSTNEAYGTNKDGSISEDYCKYCYDKGAFTMDCTMDEMIEFCVPHMVNSHTGMTEEKARSMMNEFFPHIKRWQRA